MADVIASERKFGNRFRFLSGEQKVWLLNAVLAGIACVLYFFVIDGLAAPHKGFQLKWWALAPLFLAAEVAVIHVQLKREVLSYSLNEIPLILGLFFAPPGDLVLAVLVGCGAALALHRRQSMLKLTFNVSHFCLETAMAIVVFHAVVGTHAHIGPAGWLGTLAAAFMADLIAALCVALAVSLAEGRRQAIESLLGIGSIVAFANACVALAAATVLWTHPASAWLLSVPAILLFLAYRGYSAQRQKRQSLELLYESTRVLQQSLEANSVVDTVLEQARQMLRADYAEITRFPQVKGGRAFRASFGPGTRREPLRSINLDPTEGVWARVAAEGQTILVARPIENEKLRAHFHERGIRDAIVSPLHGPDGIVGTLLVGNRLRDDLATFDSDDLKLVETLANHASISLENGRLVESLKRQAAENEFQAQHDSLTGLFNRTMFHNRVTQAIDQAGVEMVGVLLMDLDRFKEINDTLGHPTGDSLLKETSFRLRRILGPDVTIARLGGDEFAILLPRLTSLIGATDLAANLVKALRQPYELQDLSLDVSASIGISLFPQHGTDAETLMQRADVAMYIAKASHSGFEIYDGEKDQYSPNRLALVAELRRAIDERQLVVWYQPKIDLSSGRLIGAEALVRWNHPRHGMMPPDEFIGLAEHTGLIGPMTSYVLEEALQQCVAWRSSGFPDFKVAVNLSVKNLMDVDLPRQISALLMKSRLPSDALHLEITESSIMEDPERAIEVLTRLHEMGIGIAIDDFGTGYSSLAYLRRLPVDEMKIDRSFVRGMMSSENDAVIVRSVIDLGRNLGLVVVAEGIEDRESMERLEALGCTVGQGYHIARPMDAEGFDSWAASRNASEAAARPEGNAPVVPLTRVQSR
ncbi:MAG TPA: EAL domain-containing protein [Actinomycetota bacterium]|nr:EAL domain-containing protein [Actinomycetota bacterium]